MKKKQIISAIILNGLVFVSTWVVMFILFFSGYNGHGKDALEETLRYFTNLSNMYCALISLVVMINEIGILRGKYKEIPHLLIILKQTGTVAVAVTFCTVLFFLAPIQGSSWYTCYTNYLFFVHFLNPLLAIVCFIFFETGKPLSMKENFFALIPTVAYAAVYAAEVIIFKNWRDFYGFTFGGKVWAPFVVIPMMACVTYILSWLVSTLQRKIRKK